MSIAAFMVPAPLSHDHLPPSRRVAPAAARPASLAFMVLIILAGMPTPSHGLKCYVCGGSTGHECEDIIPRRWSPYVRPRPVLTSDGRRQWEECNDLINNKGCIKQVVNGGKIFIS